MAKRRSKGKSQPVPLLLNFKIEVDEPTNYIDISECVSAVSRKFMRQGLNWAVAGGKVFLPPASNAQLGSAFYISSLPHTWMVSNGWEKVMRAWLRQQNKAVSDGGSQSAVAKFRDFKIHADPDHVQRGFANNLVPYNLGPGGTAGPWTSSLVASGAVALGEWEPSQIVIPNLDPAPLVDGAGLPMSGADVVPREYHLHMVGANNQHGSRGIVDGYAKSRAYPQSPDPVAPAVENFDNFLRDMFDVGLDSNVIVNNAVNTNDDLPYDQDEYPGGETNFFALENQVTVWNSNTIGQNTHSFQGFSAPCGLLRIDHIGVQEQSPGTEQNIWLQLYLVPGPNRGYLTQPMTEM